MNTNEDELIREAMKNGSFKEFEEENIFTQMLGTFRGRNGWVAILSMIYVLVCTVVMFFSAYKFFTLDEIGDRVFWGVLLLLMGIFVGLLKTWYFMQMNRNTLLRELKRMELQVAKLAERVGP